MDDRIQKQQRKGEPKFPNVQGSVKHTFLATPSARKVKAAFREINIIVPSTPQYLKYADTSITWDHIDHPERIPDPESHALVVSPIVENIRLQRVLMDGGASINLMYLSTL